MRPHAFPTLVLVAVTSIAVDTDAHAQAFADRQCPPPPEGSYSRNWDVFAWLADHPVPPPTMRTTQTGHADAWPFHGSDWAHEIAEFRAAWSAIIGPIPESCVPLDAREQPLDLSIDEQRRTQPAAFELKHVSYRGAHGERIPAYLLLPPHIATPRPAVLVMHQALAICGKKEPAGICSYGAWNQDLGRDLAERGFVVLCPDSIGFGERAHASWQTGLEYSDAAPLLSRFPGSTLMGLRISDVMRGIDFLQSLPEVDANRIGMAGHSNGGIETLFSAAFDARIQCAISNAGPNLMRRETFAYYGITPGIARWAGFGYMPALIYFDGNLAALPVETHELYAMIAGRSLFVSLIEDDSIAPQFDQIDFMMTEAARVFTALGGNFAFHTIASGLTQACRDEWGAPFCLAAKYDDCVARGDQPCLDAFAAVGMTKECVDAWGYSFYCAWELWWNQCRAQGHGEDDCIARFAGVGLDRACIDAYFPIACRRDHGWYPETEALAYPWLEDCLGWGAR